MEELKYRDLKTDQEVTEHFDVPPQEVIDDIGVQQHVQLPGIRVQVKDDLKNKAVIMVIGETVMHVTLEGAHKLAAALNQSANRVGASEFKAMRKLKHGKKS